MFESPECSSHPPGMINVAELWIVNSAHLLFLLPLITAPIYEATSHLNIFCHIYISRMFCAFSLQFQTPTDPLKKTLPEPLWTLFTVVTIVPYLHPLHEDFLHLHVETEIQGSSQRLSFTKTPVKWGLLLFPHLFSFPYCFQVTVLPSSWGKTSIDVNAIGSLWKIEIQPYFS